MHTGGKGLAIAVSSYVSSLALNLIAFLLLATGYTSAGTFLLLYVSAPLCALGVAAHSRLPR